MEQFEVTSKDGEPGLDTWLRFNSDEQEVLGAALTHYNQFGYHQAEDPPGPGAFDGLIMFDPNSGNPVAASTQTRLLGHFAGAIAGYRRDMSARHGQVFPHHRLLWQMQTRLEEEMKISYASSGMDTSLRELR